MITTKEYREISGSSGYFRVPEFSVEEVQEFLKTSGYKIIVHKAPWAKNIRTSIAVTGEVEISQEKYEFFEPRILAIKEYESLPERNDSEDAKSKDIHIVFNKEIKRKILGI